MALHRTGKSGLGNTSSKKIPIKRSHQYRNLISTVVNKLDQDKDPARAVQLDLQGYWTNWCAYVKNNLSWKSLLALSPSLVQFCIAATYNTLSFPSNLKR